MREFVKEEWDGFLRRLSNTAEYLARSDEEVAKALLAEAADFADRVSPESYRELLSAIGDGTAMVVRWQHQFSTRNDGHAESSERTQAYSESDNHADVSMPKEPIAKQAEEAKDL